MLNSCRVAQIVQADILIKLHAIKTKTPKSSYIPAPVLILSGTPEPTPPEWCWSAFKNNSAILCPPRRYHIWVHGGVGQYSYAEAYEVSQDGS